MTGQNCNWCLKEVATPEGFDPHKHTLVCSPECAEMEGRFRRMYGDEYLVGHPECSFLIAYIGWCKEHGRRQ